jgi:D-alanyl-lipoteichoic acid acyltransferase DltB (MBOAT superfamily)
LGHLLQNPRAAFLDVYRSRIQPSRTPIDFLAVVALFPLLLSGPIERPDRLLRQFSRGRVLVSFKSLLFGKCLVSLPFVNYGGVLADENEAARALVDAARMLSRVSVRLADPPPG